MPVLHLLRHAKSGWNDEIEDHERPLSRAGRDAARLIARHLPTATGRLDLVLCSSALRTRETLDLVLAAFAMRPRVLIEDELYLAATAVLLNRLRTLAEPEERVMLIGHNPGLHELALMLARTDSRPYRALAGGKFPTAARASFRIAPGWSAIDRSQHELVDYATPKSLAGTEE